MSEANFSACHGSSRSSSRSSDSRRGGTSSMSTLQFGVAHVDL